MHWFAQALATVTRDQDQPSLQSPCSDQSPQRLIITTRNNCAQSVNDRVACNKDRRSRHSLGKEAIQDRKSTRLNSSHLVISYAVFCLKKKKKKNEVGVAST